MRYCLSIIVFLLGTFSSSAQMQTDSLLSVWNSEKLHDTVRLEALYSVAHELLQTDRQQSIEYAEEQYAYAIESNNPIYAANARYIQGVAYYYDGNYAKSLHYYHESLAMYDSLKRASHSAIALNSIGAIHTLQGQLSHAVDFYLRSLKIAEDLKDTNSIINAMRNIGGIYRRQANYRQAIYYMEQCIEISEKSNNISGLGSVYLTLGLIEIEKKSYKSAEDYLSKGLQIFEELDDKESQAFVLRNLATVMQKTGRYEEALEAADRSTVLFEEISMPRGVLDNLIAIAQFYQERQFYDEGIEYASEGLRLAREMGLVVEIRDASSVLYLCYDSLGNSSMALDMHELFKAMDDSLRRIEVQNETTRRELTYTYEKKALTDSIKAVEREKVMKAELAETKARSSKKQQLIIFLVMTILLLGVLAWILVSRQRLKVRTASAESNLKTEQLKRAEDKEKKLISDIELKDRELTTFALANAEKMELLERIKGKLDHHSESNNIAELKLLLKDHAMSANEWESFKARFETVHPNFTKSLMELCPDLTANDVKICILLRLNMTSKQIAFFAGISSKSVDQSRYRIRKKMDLTTSKKLQDILLNI